MVIAIVMKLGWMGSWGRFSEESVKKELKIKEGAKGREAIAKVTSESRQQREDAESDKKVIDINGLEVSRGQGEARGRG